jgi:hypothetical protein
VARSDPNSPNENCREFGKPTNLSVCRCCYRATVRSIYQPCVPAQRRLTEARERFIPALNRVTRGRPKPRVGAPRSRDHGSDGKDDNG